MYRGDTSGRYDATDRKASANAGSLVGVTTAEPRQVIDYALARRAVLTDLLAGRTARADVCDAHPYLIRAARYHGEPSTTRCPVCRHAEPLTHVTYVYGDGLGPASGRPRPTGQLARIAAEHGPVTVYVVEVCVHCAWNHLVSSHVRGAVRPSSRPPAAQRRAQPSAVTSRARSRAAGR